MKLVHGGRSLLLQQRYNNGEFKVPISALSIYLKAKGQLKETSFTPIDLQKFLSVLMTSKGKHQLIKRVNVEMRYYYRENLEAKT